MEPGLLEGKLKLKPYYTSIVLLYSVIIHPEIDISFFTMVSTYSYDWHLHDIVIHSCCH